MTSKRAYGVFLLLVAFALTALACNLPTIGGGNDSVTAPSNAVVVNLTANTSLEPWLRQAVDSFNSQEVETAAGDPVFVIAQFTEAGQFVAQPDGVTHLWIPDDDVWTAVLADQGDPRPRADCPQLPHRTGAAGGRADRAGRIERP